MLIQILFYVFATILVLAALGVITSRNPVYSALSLVLCFVTSAAIWLLIEAEFLAVVLVLVYVGAVMVLFLFVVMMLDINLEELRAGLHALRLARLAHRARGDRRDRRAWCGRAAASGIDVEPRRATPQPATTATPPSSAASSTPSTPIRSSSRPCCCWWRSWRPSR